MALFQGWVFPYQKKKGREGESVPWNWIYKSMTVNQTRVVLLYFKGYPLAITLVVSHCHFSEESSKSM